MRDRAEMLRVATTALEQAPASASAAEDHFVTTTHAFYDDMRASLDFVPVHEPECNTLCFRHIPYDSAAVRGRETIKGKVRDMP
jgi:hypothetical protein